MTKPSWSEGPPGRILLATDLSARCDRALDRAASLAHVWRAQLVALHVLERDLDFDDSLLDRRLPSWREPAAALQAAEEQLRHDIPQAAVNVEVLVEPGDPTEVILKTARARECRLIVTGIARDETLGRFGLGNTVDRLLRRSCIPVLVVKDRPRSPYAHIVVATDFSDSARHALQTALGFFPDHKLSVFHAFETPRGGLTTAAGSYDEDSRNAALAECATFLASIDIPDERRRGVGVLVQQGEPERLIRQCVREHGADLLVLGSQGRNILVDIFIGSTARDVLAAPPCDLLLVREPGAAAEGEPRH